MYYCLNKDIFIVDGLSKSCIYDLSKGRLYSINKALANVLKNLNKGDFDTEYIFEDKLQEIINLLIEKDIISTSTKKKSNEISDLKVENKNSKLAWVEITK